MTAVRVFVATTEGPSEVQRIAEEDPEVRSVVCLNGTSEALPISAAYDSFVRKPTGVIERLFGHPVFRMDVAERIGDGRSWQLAFAVAHALHAAGRLAGRGTAAQTAVWLTGTIDNDLNVGPVDHIPEKLKRSAALFNELRALGIPVTVVLPQENLKETLGGGNQDGGLGLEGIRIVPAEKLSSVFRKLGLPWTEPARTKPRRKGRLPLILAGLLVGGAALAGIHNRDHIAGWWEETFGEPEPPAQIVVVPPAPDAADARPDQPVPPTQDATPATADDDPDPKPSDAVVASSDEPPAGSGDGPATPDTPPAEPEPTATDSGEPPAQPAAQDKPEPPAADEPPTSTDTPAAAPDQPKPTVAEPEPEPVAKLAAQDIRLEAVERRAPGGRSCAVANFGTRGPVETPIGMEDPRRFSTSRAQGLCSVEYRIANAFAKNIRIWVYAAPIGARIGFGATTSASAGRDLAPGENLAVELKLPHWVNQPLRHRVIVVGAEGDPKADFGWIDRGMTDLQTTFDFARWAELREKILGHGLTLISAMHEIVP